MAATTIQDVEHLLFSATASTLEYPSTYKPERDHNGFPGSSLLCSHEPRADMQFPVPIKEMGQIASPSLDYGKFSEPPVSLQTDRLLDKLTEPHVPRSEPSSCAWPCLQKGRSWVLEPSQAADRSCLGMQPRLLLFGCERIAQPHRNTIKQCCE